MKNRKHKLQPLFYDEKWQTQIATVTLQWKIGSTNCTANYPTKNGSRNLQLIFSTSGSAIDQKKSSRWLKRSVRFISGDARPRTVFLVAVRPSASREKRRARDSRKSRTSKTSRRISRAGARAFTVAAPYIFLSRFVTHGRHMRACCRQRATAHVRFPPWPCSLFVNFAGRIARRSFQSFLPDQSPGRVVRRNLFVIPALSRFAFNWAETRFHPRTSWN